MDDSVQSKKQKTIYALRDGAEASFRSICLTGETQCLALQPDPIP